MEYCDELGVDCDCLLTCSDAMMQLRIFEIYTRLPVSHRSRWLRQHNIVESRMKQFVSVAKDMMRRLHEVLDKRHDRSVMTSGRSNNKSWRDDVDENENLWWAVAEDDGAVTSGWLCCQQGVC